MYKQHGVLYIANLGFKMLTNMASLTLLGFHLSIGSFLHKTFGMPVTIWAVSNLSFRKVSRDTTRPSHLRGSKTSQHSLFSMRHLVNCFLAILNITDASIDVLEQSSIAWPNQAMWRQVSLVGQYIAQQSVSPRKISGEDELHSHSPCRGIAPARSFGTKSLSGMLAPVMPKASSSSDPFTDKVNLAFQGWRRTSINDISMPDYSSSGSGYTRYPSRQVTDPMSVTGFESAAVSYSHADSYNETVGPRPPANTPQNESTARTQHTTAIDHTHTRKSISRKNTMSQAAEEIMPLSDIVTGGPDQAFAPGTVVVHQRPNANDSIKGRKENITHSPASARYGSDGANEHFNVISEAFSTAANVNNKRQRVVTPAASKAIDDEDEPRSSPTARKVSRTNAKEAQTQTQKRALRNITNNI